MKCIVLAGGSGDALWPLSRRNYPKQFIHMHAGRSPFQEAVNRNLPFCDECWILTNDRYEHIVTSQLASFQGLSYRCLLEEKGAQTAPVVLMAALLADPDEELLVVSCDHVITEGEYNSAVLEAQRRMRQAADRGEDLIVALGCGYDPEIHSREGNNFFDLFDDGRIEYIPAGKGQEGHCDAGLGGSLPDSGMERLVDSGIFLVTAASYRRAIEKNEPKLFEAGCRIVKSLDRKEHRILLTAEMTAGIEPVSIGDAVYAPWSERGKVKVVKAALHWQRLLSLGQVADIWQEDTNALLADSDGTRVINNAQEKLVVVNDAPGLLVVNDKDAVYITSAGRSSQIKNILAEQQNGRLGSYFDEGDIFYTPWGCKETLTRSADYMVKKLTILPGRSISMHRHEKRSEHWSVVSGIATIVLDAQEREYRRNESIFVPIGCYHEIRNEYARDLVVIEVSVGENLAQPGTDMIRDAGSEPYREIEKTMDRPDMVKLEPVYKDYIWGGNRMRSLFGMETELPRIAESWVLSAHRDGKCIVQGRGDRVSGPVTFDRFAGELGSEGLGWKSQPYERFPILVKFIDAERALSIQVHPADAYALEHENDYGKNEMWYVLDAGEDAFVYLGFERETTPEEVQERIRNGTLTEILHKVSVKAGDSVMVPAGCVHAIGDGLLVLEVQQSSNATYRLYDYDRRDDSGNPRPLHLKKALANMDYGKCRLQAKPLGGWEELKGYRKILLQQCKYFSVTRLEVDGVAELVMDESSFVSLVCVAGSGQIGTEKKSGETVNTQKTVFEFRKGDSYFLPAGSRIIRITGESSWIYSNI